MRNIIFTVSTWNLGDTTAMLEVARACSSHFKPIFVCYGPNYLHLVKQAGFPTESGPGAYYTPVHTSSTQLRPFIQAELQLWQKYQPIAIINRHELMPVISARAAGIPLIWLLPFAWTRPCYEAGFTGEQPMKIIEHWFKRFNKPLPTEASFLSPFQTVSREFCGPALPTLYDLFEGDYTLLYDVPEMTGVTRLRPNYHYIGPLFARLAGEIPEAIHHLPQDRPIIYFALGSSGQPHLVKQIIEGFAQRPSYFVIAPVKPYLRYLKGARINIPDNVLVTDWLPAHKVNTLADISVTNGGLGTLHTACLAGTPIVGISMHKEQEINLNFLARLKCATHIDRQMVSAQVVLQSVDHMLKDKTARERMHALREKIRSWDGPENINQFLQKTLIKTPVEKAMS